MLERLYCAAGFALWVVWVVTMTAIAHETVTFRGKQIWKR